MFKVQEIEEIVQGKLIQGSGEVRIKGVSINSKTVKKGDLFCRHQGRAFRRPSVYSSGCPPGCLGGCSLEKEVLAE